MRNVADKSCGKNKKHFVSSKFLPESLAVSISNKQCDIQGAYKLSEDFAKPYFHKYRTEIHDVTII